MAILGVSGSLRQPSHNHRLLVAASAELTSGLGGGLEIYSGLAEIPPYQDDIPAPATVGRLRAAIARADAVLFATPEYNASIPGQLKNALDWVSRPWPDNALRGKPVAVVGASTGLFGAVWAQAELRKVLQTIGAEVVDAELPIGLAEEAFGPDGELLDPSHRGELRDILKQLTTLTDRPIPAGAAAA